MTSPITPTEELEDQITEIIYGADWKNDPLTYTAFKPDVRAAMALFEQYAAKRVMEELNKVDDELYDINETEWGIPTKWSNEQFKGEKYADLWSPNKAIHEVMQNKIKALEASLIDKEKA